jgi:DNA-directed RNA polymerase subunit omega
LNQRRNGAYRKVGTSGTSPKAGHVLRNASSTLGTDESSKQIASQGGVPMKLIEGFDSNYRYILVAARRARQLQSGAPPVVDTNSRKPCRIAQDEIRAGKVKWEIPDTRTAAEQAGETLDKALGQD